MSSAHLKSARLAAEFTQQEAAARLGVSQPYYSQLESGLRRMPAGLALTAVRKLRLSPVTLPLPPLALHISPVEPDELAVALAGLGYPGFAHLARTRTTSNPAELAVRALAHADLETRLVEALPWVLATFCDLSWSWLVAQCRILNLQNRLGFLVALANRLERPNAGEQLRKALAALESSRLSAEGTLCRESMSQAERNWVRKHRSPDAAHWNLLTTLTADQLTHAA
jgi:transcriptional regulator with XRE-family HTH domain